MGDEHVHEWVAEAKVSTPVCLGCCLAKCEVDAYAKGLEAAAKMLEEQVSMAIGALEAGLRSEPDTRQAVEWKAARDVLRETIRPVATRIRALGTTKGALE